MPSSLYAPAAIVGLYRTVQKHLSVRTDGLPPSAFIAAAKNGYHDSRAGNPSSDYSVQAPADRRGDRHAASAVDISLSPAGMRLVTTRLVNACKEKDPRVECVREVIGSYDGNAVVTYNRYATGSGTRSRVGLFYGISDNSHRWHVHISFFRDYANDEAAMQGVADVITGVKTSTPKPSTGGTVKPKPEAKPKPVAKGAWYHVDPKKVTTTLLGLSASGRVKLHRRPRKNLYIARIVTRFGRQNGVTSHGTHYALQFLKEGKAPPKDPGYEVWHVSSRGVSSWLWGLKNGVKKNVRARPGRNIKVVRWATKNGRTWAVTKAGNWFAKEYLEKGKS